MIYRIVTFLILFCCASTAAGESWTVSSHGLNVPFSSWHAEGAKTRTGVLVLVPGYNGQGEQMLDTRWKSFATTQGLVLLAPTFHADGNENNEGRGYFYPEQGSGEVMVQALEEVKRRTGVATDKILFFGFSAGAHYVHRFALWQPQRVKAFVAYSAGWWSEPNPSQKAVPALIMCGEGDERYEATFQFFKKGQHLGCPWLWRSYTNLGHEVSPAVRSMAETFLAHYADIQSQAPKTEPRWGDYQTFHSVNMTERDTISAEFRIQIPSQAIADIWEKEANE